MDIKILIATHKKYKMPNFKYYLPIHVGKEGKEDIGFIGDNTGDNISKKNPYYCELTALYWGWKNLKCDYIGLVHYRRYFSNKFFLKRTLGNKYNMILNDQEIESLLKEYDVILPKKRKYYIETLYSHYANTYYREHLDETRKIIEKNCKEYLIDFDYIMKQRSGYMFNMFIMKKDYANKYCEWLFPILNELEDKIDYKQYDAFNARLFGRVSELLLNVWIEHNKLTYKEIPYIYMEKIDWINKIICFLKAKFLKQKYSKSF